MSKTLQERFVEALVKRGNTIVPSKSRKCITLLRKDPGTAGPHYFVGKAGSLRIGRIPTKSVPCNAKFKAQLLLETEK